MLDNECNMDTNIDDSEDDDNMTVRKKRRHLSDEEGEESNTEAEDSESGEWSDEDMEECSESNSGSDEEGTESEDDDSEDEETDEDEADDTAAAFKNYKCDTSLGENSDSDPNSRNRETCAICLSYMKGEIGSPELCDHSFCLECILEWAKTNNSCPQDRTQFLQIFVRRKVKGKIIRTITVQEVKPDDIIVDEDEEPTFCEVCGRCDREDTLLLCDGCDSGHHLECLSPPLNSVPINEWFCSECQALNRERASQEVNIALDEITDLIDDAGLESQLSTRRRRQLPRTSASERVRRIITRARTERGDTFVSLENEYDDDSEENGAPIDEISTSSQKRTTTKVNLPAKKKRKIAVKRRRKVKRKTTTKKKTKAKTTKKKTTKRRKKRKTKARKTVKGNKRKTRRKKRKGKTTKKKGKKKVAPPVIITPKARLAEALGIRPMKNPWQLSVPAMTGSLSQGPATLTNQRWRAGVPSLSLLGSNSELDYISEPDEFGDAILVAGVRRGHSLSVNGIARRKALAVEMMRSRPSLGVMNDRLSNLPISDSNISSVGDLLDNIIESQSQLHKNLKSNAKNIGKENEINVKKAGIGSDSPPRDGKEDSNRPAANEPSCFKQQNHYNSSVLSQVADNGNYTTGIPFIIRSSNGDPTGSKAYSSYLQEHINPNVPGDLSKKDKKNAKKEDKRKNPDEEVNLYSDIEPEASLGYDEDDSENDADVQDKAQAADHNDNDSPLSGDELVIDDTVRHEVKENESFNNATVRLDISASTNSENEVGSSNLPGLNDFDLEEVSDTDSHEMEKSMNSSISLSDSNMGDAEVTSSTNEVNLIENSTRGSRNQFPKHNRLGQRGYSSSTNAGGVGLRRLETETISDNEEMCFEDNYEEGEIPSDNVSRALPSKRPRINIQLKRVNEVSSPNKEFDGDCEEGEIVDDSAARKERREKAKREVDEVVNPPAEVEPNQKEEKENLNPEQPSKDLPVLSGASSNSPNKILVSPEKTPSKKAEKNKDSKESGNDKGGDKTEVKEKEPLKEMSKDISFKKVSSSTKVRNYRDNDKNSRNKRKNSRDRSFSRERGRYSRERNRSNEKGNNKEKSNSNIHSRDRYRRNSGKRKDSERGKDRSRRDSENKKEPKRKEIERYNVRQMINKKEEEKKKKDEFGRDVSLRGDARSSHAHSRSRSRGRSRSKSKKNSKTTLSQSNKRTSKFSRSRSRSRNLGKSKRRRSYSSSSSSSSSTSTSSSSSSSYSSSSSSSRSRSRSRKKTRDRRRRSRTRTKSPVKKKKVEKKKLPIQEQQQSVIKPKEKTKKAAVPVQKKDEKKEKRKDKEEELPKFEKQKKKRKREKTPLTSKEVYQAGGSIMVSVNFSQRNSMKEKDLKKKDKDAKFEEAKKRKKPDQDVEAPYARWSPRNHRERSGSPDGKHTPLQDEPMWSPENNHHGNRIGESRKSPDVIDLDVIMVTPPPQEAILISDSEDEGITRLPPDLGAQQLSPLSRNQGPKTPPEPGVKFTLSNKQILKTINNPLMDEEDNSEPVLLRGPNTPPGPPPESDESVGRPKSPSRRVPRSPAGTPTSSPEPDAYDPFEPTKSPSPPISSPQQEPRVSSSDQTEQNHLNKSPDSHNTSPIKGKIIHSPGAPPLPAELPSRENNPPEPRKAPEDEASSTVVPPPLSHTITSSSPLVSLTHSSVASGQITTSVPSVTPLTTVNHMSIPVVQNVVNSQVLNPMQQIFAGLPANVANILYPAAIAAAAMRGAANTLLRPPVNQPMIPPDFSRPPPPTASLMSRPPPTTPVKSDKMKINQNGQSVGDIHDVDGASPTSPDSSDVSDMFEPPSPMTGLPSDKTSPRKPRASHKQKVSPVKSVKTLDRFDVLFGSGSDARSSRTSHKSKENIVNKVTRSKNGPGKKNDAEEDIPNSAVDLQVKEKLIKKVQRQERVIEEVKLCLKPYYNKKVISKEDYKDIMKRCVQKVCHNRSGEINPNKIRSLVEGYIKKVKYYRKKFGGNTNSGILSQVKGGGPLLPPSAMDPPPPGLGHLSKAHVKIKP